MFHQCQRNIRRGWAGFAGLIAQIALSARPGTKDFAARPGQRRKDYAHETIGQRGRHSHYTDSGI